MEDEHQEVLGNKITTRPEGVQDWEGIVPTGLPKFQGLREVDESLKLKSCLIPCIQILVIHKT